MKALILAAGRGSRMKSLTKDKPKCFLNLFGKSLILRQINILKKSGIKDIGIVVGYKRDKFKEFKIKLFKNSKWKTTNMVFSLFKAKNWLFNDDFIVCYSDIFYHKDVIKKLILSKSNISIPYFTGWKKNWKMRYRNPLDDLETFRINNKNELIQIGRKPKNYAEINGQFMGLVKFKKEISIKLFNYYKNLSLKIKKNIQMTDFLNLCVNSKKFKINTIKTSTYWYEFDNFKDYMAAIKDIKKRKIKL